MGGVEDCRVCGTALPAGATHCPKCGFPVALGKELNGPIHVPSEPEGLGDVSPTPAGGSGPESLGPDSEVNASLARGLEDRSELLRSIDRDAPDMTAELCEAALTEASGRASDAQQILRSAQARMDRETEELLGRHLENLESRGRALQSTGLRLALESELGSLAEGFVGGEAAASVAALAAAERRLDAIEAHWRGLQALLAQVTTLREQAAALGISLDGLPDRVATIRADLAAAAVTERELDLAAQTAAEALMRLHEAIPPALERELARHDVALREHPARSARAQPARRRHAEAVDHLKSGRLEDAVRSVRELREALNELARESEAAPPPVAPTPAPVASPPSRPVPARRAEPATIPTPSAPSSSTVPASQVEAAAPAMAPPTPSAREGAGPPDAATITALMQKVRSLAARVRSLPPESPQAASAATQIHEATELLRAHRYAEADAALSRLMRALVQTGDRS